MATPDYSAWERQASEYDDAIAAAEKKHGLPPGFLRKQLIVESGLDPAARSTAPNSHATGIAQMQPGTARGFGIDPRDPHASIDAAAQYDAQLYKQFGSWGKALVAYHDGPGAVAAGRVSPEAIQYREHFMAVPDRKTTQTAPGDEAGASDPFALIDAAHADAKPSSGSGDPFAAIDAARGENSHELPEDEPAAGATDQQARAVQAARQAYDESSFPERVAISAGAGATNLLRGAQSVGADIAEGVGRLAGIDQLRELGARRRAELAAAQQSEAAAQAGTHGASDVVGRAIPYLVGAGTGAGAGAGLAARLGAAAVGGAATGALGGAAEAPAQAGIAEDVEGRLRGAAAGGAAGAALGPLAEGAGTALGAAGKAVANRLRGAGGPERTAAAHINSLMPEGVGFMDTSAADRVPGYTPSAAEASGDARLAYLDREMRAHHDQYRELAEGTDRANDAAIHNAVSSIRGDETTLARLYEDRAQQTAPLYDAAAQEAQRQGARVDTTPVWRAAQNLIKANQGHTSVTDALGKYLRVGSLYDEMPNGKLRLTSDVQRLANIRNQMSTDIGKQFAKDSTGADMKAAARPLMEMRDVIDQQLAKANPALAKARETFAKLSEPINQQEALQKLLPPQKDGKGFTSSQLSQALTALAKDRKASGANPAKSLTPEHIQQLEAVRDVLAQREKVRSTKTAPGKDVRDAAREIVQGVSNTGSWNPLLYAQHLGAAGGAAAGLASNFLGLGAVHPGLAAAASMAGATAGGALGRLAGRAAERGPSEVRAALANYLLDPAHYPVPATAPAAYRRSAAGVRAARGARNALISTRTDHDHAGKSTP